MPAYTIHYTEFDAPGTGDGTSGDPWTIEQAFSNATTGKIVKVRPGTYTPTATLNNSAQSTVFAGVDGSDNYITSVTDTLPILDFVGQSSGFGIDTGSYQSFLYGLDVRNAFTIGIDGYRDMAICNCKIHGNGSVGIQVNAYATIAQCHIYDNTTYGINFASAGALVWRSKLWDNTSDNISLGSSGNHIVGCEFPNATDYTGNNITGGQYGAVLGNSFFDGTDGIDSKSDSLIGWNIFKNAVTYGIGGGDDVWCVSNAFHGNGTDINAGLSYILEIDKKTADPSFTDPSTQDLSIGNTDYQNYLADNGAINIGADQGRAGAGGGNSRRNRGRYHRV